MNASMAFAWSILRSKCAAMAIKALNDLAASVAACISHIESLEIGFGHGLGRDRLFGKTSLVIRAFISR